MSLTVNSKDSEIHTMKTIVILHTNRLFDDVCSDLKTAIEKHGYGLLAIHDLGATLRRKNIGFLEDCRIFEVCDPQQAAKVLSLDMSLSMFLPCRISVFTEAGKTRIGMIRPQDMLKDRSAIPELIKAVHEVESAMTALILAAGSPASISSTC